MTDKKTIKLIDGTFDSIDAAEILFSLLDAKIRFHNIQILSVAERFNGDTKDHENRLQELEKSRKIVADLIVLARDKKVKIEIDSTIDITLNNI